MPVTFEGVSEYRRNFVVPQSLSDSTHSPTGKRSGASRDIRELEPHPQLSHVTSAGVTSAKLAVTQEPAFSRKRKPLDNEKKVTFTTDYAEHGSPTKEDDKAMKFRAGFRRVNVPSSTEYSLQYSWKDQVPEPSPIIRAEQLLNSQHLNQRGGPSNYRHNEETGGHSTKERETVSNGESFERRKPQVVSQQNSAGSKHDDVIDGSCDLEEHTRGRGEMVQRLRQESRVKSPPKEGGVRHAHGSGTKVSKRKHKSHHHSNSGSKKKHKSGRGFVSEYKREFKAWPIPSSTSVGVAYSISKGEDVHLQVAGSPQKLTDSSDPRLLKHKPLPPQLPIARWGSEYSSNFMSPTDFKYEGGVWKGAPRPDLFVKVEGKSKEGPSGVEAVDQSSTTPWFDQLLELRQRAEEYKTRAEGVQFPPYHLSRHRRDIDVDSSVTTTTTTSSVTSRSDERSEGGMYSPSLSSTTSPTEGERREVRLNREQDRTIKQQQQSREKKQTRLFNHALPTTKMGHKAERVGKRERSDLQQIEVEDIEDNWESQTITEDGGSSRDTPQTGLSPQMLTQQNTRAELGTFREPEVARSKSIPRPDANRERDGEVEGRVPTPELRRSNLEQQSRHHLDTTTPSGGGILISPEKPAVSGYGDMTKLPIQLPFPPTSPKYRRDMKSKAPIFPSPKRQVGNGRQDTSIDSEEVRTFHSVSTNLAPHIVPSSQSPYHTRCVPHPSAIPRSSHTHSLLPSHTSHVHPHTTSQKNSAAQLTSAKASSFSGPVRKLFYDSHTKPTSQTVQPSSSSQSKLHKSHSKSSHTNVVRSCDTCGSHLRSPHVLGGGVGSLGAGRASGFKAAPTTNLSRLHEEQTGSGGGGGGVGVDPLLASWQESQLKLQQIRSKLGSRSSNLHHRSSSPYVDQQHHPDSGLGSSNREGTGGRGDLRSEDLGVGRGGGGRDVDELSLSSLSLSSCSVASDVLRKARERRDRFWTQPSHITAS